MAQGKKFVYTFLALVIIQCMPFVGNAQKGDSLLSEATLPNVVAYALEKQPLVQQALIDEQILKYQVKSKLADWFPQLEFTYAYQRNFQLPTIIFNGSSIKTGVNNTSALQLSLTQTLFNPDVLLASRSKDVVELQGKQQTTATKIDVVANVVKAFYAVLATEQQIKVNNETIIRLQKSLQDARAQYDAGLVDKTDYKRATISLNNSLATKTAAEEDLKARLAFLKYLMNYPPAGELNILYDSASLERGISLDTLQQIDYSKRIEYQVLETRKKLLQINYQYNKWSYLPTVSADGAYIANYLNDEFSKLYSNSFPNSYAGISLHFPIFQGGKRKYNIRQAALQVDRVDQDLIDFRNSASSEYANALAAYKSSLVFFRTTKENVSLAQEVYDVIRLQYRSGIKTYLEVITAETDLRTAELNYFNALYQVLSSKIDVQKSLGNIPVSP